MLPMVSVPPGRNMSCLIHVVIIIVLQVKCNKVCYTPRESLKFKWDSFAKRESSFLSSTETIYYYICLNFFCINTNILCSKWEQVCKADKISPASLQAVQKSSTDVIWGDITLVEGLPSRESKAQAEARVVKTEKLVQEVPEGSAMRNIFSEIQLLAGTGPNSQLIEVS